MPPTPASEHLDVWIGFGWIAWSGLVVEALISRRVSARGLRGGLEGGLWVGMAGCGYARVWVGMAGYGRIWVGPCFPKEGDQGRGHGACSHSL